MNVNLFFLIEGFSYGGFFSYTEHLYRSLAQMGHTPQIFKISNKTELRQREFRPTIPYQNLNIDDACSLAHCDPSLIVCLYWKGGNPEAASRLFDTGCGLVIHDPTEYSDEMIQVAKGKRVRIIVIRKTNEKNLSEMGLAPTFIPHPYCRTPVQRFGGGAAASISRIDYDKHTEIIAEANQMLSPACKIDIYGEIGRLYEFHKLSKSFPGWRDNYKGTFPKEPGTAVKLASNYKYIVDMSAIKGDGGGTQYTFLEAWDARTALIINRKWIVPNGVLQDGVNCYAVDNAGLLADQVATAPDSKIIQAGEEIVDKHSPKTIIPQYEKFFSKA